MIASTYGSVKHTCMKNMLISALVVKHDSSGNRQLNRLEREREREREKFMIGIIGCVKTEKELKKIIDT